jgi:hypothetical protein
MRDFGHHSDNLGLVRNLIEDADAQAILLKQRGELNVVGRRIRPARYRLPDTKGDSPTIMTKRPTSITALSWLCILFGVAGVPLDILWMAMVDPLTGRIHLFPGVGYSDMHPLAMWLFPAQWFFLAVCGVFMLRGFNWARWMLVAWVVYHIFQSIAHTRFELMFEVFTYVHSPWESFVYLHLFISILCIIFRPEACRYFRGARAAA